ncbi:sterile alpha motif domain-containing protein 3-like isoform X3 [Lates japonicus]|uniref:Sterile alpha motif domain-containing protein 3-like isoform X3 n=1 Tax=Lates japonicus TaxID=270547 RepID=A0AAD3RJ77_LATJO|nr:sterile alpha motif domain-containing protein 3-like isoform X3 [Lates japonicus]
MKWTSTPLTVTTAQAKTILPFYIVHSNHKFEENEIDGATLLGLSERMCEWTFPKIKDQVHFMSLLSTLKE